MNEHRLKISAIAAVIPFFTAIAGVGAPVTTYSRAGFATATADLDVTVEGWEGFAVGKTFAQGETANGITYSYSLSPGVVPQVINVGASTTTPNTLAGSPSGGGPGFVPGDTITFTFEEATNFFAIDINSGQLNVDGAYQATTDTGVFALSQFDPFPSSSFGHFLGFSDPMAFNSVTIGSTPAGAGFAFALDTIQTARVPEPSSVLVWCIFACAIFCRLYGRQSDRSQLRR